MGLKIIRVIAPLPPKGNVAARHAGRVIHLLDAAGEDVRPSTTISPAYSLDHLRFAPKRAYKQDRERLLEKLHIFVLYPEGLEFAQITQEIWWHRLLERIRRLGLVWRMLRRARQSVVMFRPSLLKKPDHLAMVTLALAAKFLRPRAVRIWRQKNAPEVVISPLLRATPAPVTAADSELASLSLAVKHGAKGVVRLTPVWLRAAYHRLPESDPLHAEIKTLTEIVNGFGEGNLPVLNAPSGFITAPPFTDPSAPPLQGVEMSGFMMHLHHAHALSGRFPLDSVTEVECFKNWLRWQAPKHYPHAHFHNSFEPIGTDSTPESLAAALHKIIDSARFFGAEKCVSPKLADWLNTALPSGLTRLQFLLAVLAHAPLSSIESLQKPWESKELAPWFTERAFASYPLLAALAELPTPASPPALLTTGDSDTDTGLGQNQRMSAAALKGLTPKRHLCLHHVNADGIPAQMLRHHTPGTTHIGFLLWELEALPEAHTLAGQVLDEVWAPTRFVERIYKRAYDIPVTLIGKGFDLPKPAVFAPSRLGLRPDQPFFLLSFDLHSSVARKNPLAAVHAFQMAFDGQPDARLVVKTSPPPKRHWGDPEKQMLIIKKLMARDPRIILFQEHLPFADYLGLIKAATALVSPHRSEGFGYVPAYAMALGTPVIATDYAGTQDFCTPETALTIPWRKRLVRQGESIFPLKDAFWAEIDHDALAKAMQEVITNPEAAHTRAANGQALMLKEHSIAAQRQRYMNRLTALGIL